MNIDNPEETFNFYMDAKGKYHNILSKNYLEVCKKASEAHNDELASYMKEFSKREHAHSVLLTASAFDSKYSDIKKSEAMKIQISRFIFNQSPSSVFDKINPKQIADYIDNADKYFRQMHKKACNTGDSLRITYYKDCIELMNSWIDVKNWMEFQMSKPDSKNYTARQYEDIKNNHDLFMSKITECKIKTLDEVVVP